MSAPQHFDLSRTDEQEALAAAAEALDRGELVVVPTETVYGVAAREDRPAARERLAALKRGRSSPYSLAIDDPERVAGRLLPWPANARRMAARWWPGPVTLVLADRQGGTLGLRVPGHPWTRRLVAAAGVPLLLPSANAPEAPPPVTAADVTPDVLAHVAVVVDGGRAALGNASTVVRADRHCLRILREGVVSRADLQRHAAGTVLVVCSGNTCRSPMARALLEQALAARVAREPGLVPPAVLSAGVHASDGAPPSLAAVEALAERDLDLSAHRSRALGRALLAEVDLVLAMTVAQLDALVDLAPDLDLQAELFDPAGREVDDPFGGDLRVYAACADMLAGMAAARAAALCSPAEVTA